MGARSQTARFGDLSSFLLDTGQVPALYFRPNASRFEPSPVPVLQRDKEVAQILIHRQIDQARPIALVNSSTATWSSAVLPTIRTIRTIRYRYIAIILPIRTDILCFLQQYSNYVVYTLYTYIHLEF